MSFSPWPARWAVWPRTLGSRLFLILLAGLAVAHLLSFSVLFLERYMSAKSVMMGTLERDVGTAVDILDRLPAAERPDWLGRLARPTYRYMLDDGAPGLPELSGRGPDIAESIRKALDPRFDLRIEQVPDRVWRLQGHLKLSDGSPLTIDIRPSLAPLADWLPYVLFVQLLLLVLCCWIAVRFAIRPLIDLSRAVDGLDPSKGTQTLSEHGPKEVAYAATAFNSMQKRIALHLQERVQILAAISHDLQTPITRMKLRAEMADDTPEKEKLLQDIDEIERLVREGVAYARTAHGDAEKPAQVDIGSFVESLAYDYQDTGKAVTVSETFATAILIRPNALRRILTNLVDNALKFGGEAEIAVARMGSGAISIRVLDRGPGVPEDQLEAVMQPFYRLEQSRNRSTGGTGLGLAIAQQLALALHGTLTLRNRGCGGLCAELRIPG
jgi:signal transduction histidine kinase